MLTKTEEEYLEMVESKFGKDKALEYRKILEDKKLVVTQPEPEKEIEPEESEQDETEISEQDVREKKIAVLDAMLEKLDEDEKDYSTISFEKLPLELQQELKKRVEEIFEHDKKAVEDAMKKTNEQFNESVKKANEDLLKQQVELETEIKTKANARLVEALKSIDELFEAKEPISHIRRFCTIYLAMQKDPFNNLEWVIRLYATKEGRIEMVMGNLTKEKSE